jgi:hypothetical protein
MEFHVKTVFFVPDTQIPDAASTEDSTVVDGGLNKA